MWLDLQYREVFFSIAVPEAGDGRYLFISEKKSRNKSGKAAPLFKSKKEAAVKELGWGFVMALENGPIHLQVTGSWQRRNSWILVITLALSILSQDTRHYTTLHFERV